jgi:hypothetical protein
MAAVQYVFCLLREPPQERGDHNYWMVEYARRRHAHGRIKVVKGIEEILDILLKDGDFKKNAVEKEIYIYHHGSSDGSVMGSLANNTPFHPITKAEAVKFQGTSKKVAEVSRMEGSIKKLFLIGCNIGQDLQAYQVWKKIFGSNKAEVTTSMKMVDWGVLQYQISVKDTKGNKHYPTMLTSRQDIENLIVKIKNDKVINKFLATKKQEQDFRQKLEKAIDVWLKEKMLEMKASVGKKFTFPFPFDIQGLSDADLGSELKRYYFANGGIPIMVLSMRPIPREVWDRGLFQDRKTLVQKFGVIFPSDPKWNENLRTESYTPVIDD